jgi:hypothetical protein
LLHNPRVKIFYRNIVRHLQSTILYAVVCITGQTNNDLGNTRVLSEKRERLVDRKRNERSVAVYVRMCLGQVQH